MEEREMARFRSMALAGLLPLFAMAPVAGFAQNTAPPPPAGQPAPAAPAPADPAAPAVTYTTAQLDQMLAPIALYPDTLLGEVLMASTYPIQVVEAQRWLQTPANAAIKGDALVAALEPMTWDPSVKSLVPFPEVLKQLGDQLDWTQSLGTAFANQQADVMAQVQVLRHQSESCGKLVSTPQIRVSHEGPHVIIEPANPAVVYVPVYNPAVVYGTWAYADYPPFYFPPYPGFYVGPVGLDIGFSVGFGVIDPFWGWGRPAWGAGNIFIDGGRFSRISFNHAGFAGSTFHHDGPVGRVGAAAFHGPGAAGFHGAAAARGFSGASAARGMGTHGANRAVGHSAAHGLSQHAGAHSFSGHSSSHAGNFGHASAGHAAHFSAPHGAASHSFASHGSASHASGASHASRGSSSHGSSGGHHH
jgi:Protein of unknown function (DUF3300)